MLCTLHTPGVGSRRNIGIETSVFVIWHIIPVKYGLLTDRFNSELVITRFSAKIYLLIISASLSLDLV